MHVEEIWRYSIKSLKGEQLTSADVSRLGIAQDREIVIVRNDRIATARRYPKLLGLHGSLDEAGIPTINGHRWNTSEAHNLIQEAIGGPARLVQVPGAKRFDVLPLLVATDGAIGTMALIVYGSGPTFSLAALTVSKSAPGRESRFVSVKL